MLFNSYQFLIFFISITFLYFIIPHKYRWVLLLSASYYFYMSWKAEYIILILLSTFVDYICGIKIDESDSLSKKKIYLIISISINLLILFGFKYFNFFSLSINTLLNGMNIFRTIPYSGFLLPVGISFYTFQTMSYTIDIYLGKRHAEKHLGIFALYVSFFPQLVAGPIERSTHLLPQFREKHHWDSRRIAEGIKIILWGLFKKIVIADRMAILVNTVFETPALFEGFPLILSVIFFSIQIYCDFSGYSDIAIGTAKVMGFDIMLNFRRPYWAISISDFWKRWHISLSTWFRDYLYFPLGGNRVAKARWIFNIVLTFLLSGLWHGAAWTFIIWGFIHSIYLITEKMLIHLFEKNRFIKEIKKHWLMRIFAVLSTNILILFAWIFFRSVSINDAFYIIIHMFKGFSWNNIYSTINLGLSAAEILICMCSLLLMLVIDCFQRGREYSGVFIQAPVIIRWLIYIIIIAGILMFPVTSKNEFIYFQF